MPAIILPGMAKVHGYAFGLNRDPADLRAAGAETVWIDTDKFRHQREAMMANGALRPGDTLLLFYLRDLGGAPRADEIWRKRVEARGVTIRLIGAPDAVPKKRGPKPKYAPDLSRARQDHAIWTDGTKSETERLALISAANGYEVKRGVLHSRYGGPSAPKPLPGALLRDEGV